MRNPLLAPLILLALAVGLYLLPDGAFHFWQLSLRGAFARLLKPPDPREDASLATFSDCRDALDLVARKDAEIADLHRRLASLGVTREEVPSMGIVPAKVIRLGPDNNLDSYTIDVGSRDGVAPGQAVVVGGALVGVVARSEADASLVLSLASTGCYISARLGAPEGSVGRPRLLGAARGDGGGDVRAVVYGGATAAKEGWLAITSGLEKEIPEGLLLGRLAGRFLSGREDGTLEAELRPAMELSDLDFVTVLIRK